MCACLFCDIQFAHPTFGWCRRKPRPCAQLCSTRSLRSSPVTQVCLQWMLGFPVSANRFIDLYTYFYLPLPQRTTSFWSRSIRLRSLSSAWTISPRIYGYVASFDAS